MRRRRLFVPIRIGNDRIVALALVGVLCFLLAGRCSFPSLTREDKEAQRIANEHQAEVLALERQIAAEKTQQELEKLTLQLEELRARHAVKLKEIERNAKIGAILAPTWAVFRVALAAFFLAGCAGLLILGYRVSRPTVQWVERKAQESLPTPTGQYPVRWVVAKDGTLLPYNPNRSFHPSGILTLGPGRVDVRAVDTTHPLLQAQVTANDQETQRAAARFRNAPEIVKVNTTHALPESTDPKAPMLHWPNQVPLTGLLRAQGGSTLNSIVLGMTLNPETGQHEVVKAPLVELSHIGIGGTSGWGKTRCCESLLFQLITARERPDVAIIDLKRELSHFGRSDRLLWPVATSADAGAAIFQELIDELRRRLKLFESVGGCLDLDDYNQRRGDNPALTPICLLADECTMLLKGGDKMLLQGIQDLALVGRSSGLLMILSGQNWKVTNAGGSEVRDQLSTRLQFKATSKSQSRLLIDCSDAADLNERGRAIAILPGRERMELQAPIVNRGEIERILAGQKGARHAAPEIVDVTPEKRPDPKTAEIVAAYKEQGSISAAARAVFGTAGGNDFYRAKEILQAEGLV